jgi:hypothetical protein
VAVAGAGGEVGSEAFKGDSSVWEDEDVLEPMAVRKHSTVNMCSGP